MFDEAADDDVAGGIVARLADEVVALARVALERLELTGTDVEIVLGGGLLSPGHPALIDAIVVGVRDAAPAARVRVNGSPPIVGAALMGLDELGAGNGAHARARAELEAAKGETHG